MKWLPAAVLEGRIRFDQIPRVIEEVLSATESGHLESIQKVCWKRMATPGDVLWRWQVSGKAVQRATSVV